MTMPVKPCQTFVFDLVRTDIYRVNKGEGLIPHQHNFEHLTLCLAGHCQVRIQDREGLINLCEGDPPILLPRDRWHEVTALKDNTVFVNMFTDNSKILVPALTE